MAEIKRTPGPFYRLDPDFRKNPPRNEDGTFKSHCARCQREIKDVRKAIAVTVNWETWEVAEGHDVDMRYDGSQQVIGNHLLGSDCFAVITKAKATA